MCMETTTINRKTYEVRTQPTGPLSAADLKARGWDGTFYMLTGTKGATYLALKSASTGEFKIMCG